VYYIVDESTNSTLTTTEYTDQVTVTRHGYNSLGSSFTHVQTIQNKNWVVDGTMGVTQSAIMPLVDGSTTVLYVYFIRQFLDMEMQVRLTFPQGLPDWIF
jgi:hypothetical protein